MQFVISERKEELHSMAWVIRWDSLVLLYSSVILPPESPVIQWHGKDSHKYKSRW